MLGTTLLFSKNQTDVPTSSQKIDRSVVRVREATIHKKASFDSIILEKLSKGSLLRHDKKFTEKDGFIFVEYRYRKQGWIQKKKITPIIKSKNQINIDIEILHKGVKYKKLILKKSGSKNQPWITYVITKNQKSVNLFRRPLYYYFKYDISNIVEMSNDQTDDFIFIVDDQDGYPICDAYVSKKNLEYYLYDLGELSSKNIGLERGDISISFRFLPRTSQMVVFYLQVGLPQKKDGLYKKHITYNTKKSMWLFNKEERVKRNE